MNDKAVVEYWFLRGFDGPGGEEKRLKWDRLIELARIGETVESRTNFHGPNCPCTMCT